MSESLIYLASPYSDPDAQVRTKRFHEVCLVAAKLMERGFLIFSPIAHTHPIAAVGGLPKDWEFWERYDRAFLVASSELWVLMTDGWSTSKGVAGETRIMTEELKKPVKYISPSTLELYDAPPEHFKR